MRGPNRGRGEPASGKAAPSDGKGSFCRKAATAWRTKRRDRQVADEADEIAFRRIKQPKRRRILLAARTVVVITDGFQADHRHDVLAPLPASPGVDPRAHLLSVGIRRLLVDERHEAERPAGLATGGIFGRG